MLHDSWYAATDLYDLNDDSEFARYYVSSGFETYSTTFNILEETLSLDDVTLEDETTYIDEKSCYWRSWPIYSSSQETWICSDILLLCYFFS